MLGGISGSDSPTSTDGLGAGRGSGDPVYHRLEAHPNQTAQIAAQQVASREIWGRPIGNGGAFPAVKAYWGPLPPGQNGIEFTTPIPPTHPNPSMALWIHGYHPSIRRISGNPDDFAAITVSSIRKVP